MQIVAITVKGDSGHEYDVRIHADGVVMCGCPAWKFQNVAPAERTCKHVKFLKSTLFASAVSAS